MQRPEEPTLSPAAGFIQHCARVYGRAGMKQVCLALQDRHGLNVNCLLAAVWAADQELRLTPADWTALRTTIAPIEERATWPIRDLRRSIQADVALDPGLRAGLKRLLLYAELRAEQAVESVLHREILRLGRSGPASARENVLAYAREESPELLQFLALMREAE